MIGITAMGQDQFSQCKFICIMRSRNNFYATGNWPINTSMNSNLRLWVLLILSLPIVSAQEISDSNNKRPKEMVVERERPAEWNDLIFGGRFMDRFLPMPDLGGVTANTWGAQNVIPRDISNGVESPLWSYWGGNTRLGKDGKYHLFVCRWPENAPKGHMAYHDSRVVHGESKSPFGPFRISGEVGHGHNPTWYIAKNGRYILYVIDKYYMAEHINGPWREREFKFDKRDREVSQALNFMHNCTFSQREDGSFLMVNRHGYPWFSKDGISKWSLVGEKSVYPPVEGKYEDPVVWKDNIQYHLIVNDWLGRIAWYLRSKDGVSWKIDPGEAYMPGISKHENGTDEDWHKYERIRILQDEHGRAIAANFAVIDTLKFEDLPNDNHSSKLIVVPLVKDRLLTIMNEEKINSNTEEIILKIAAEKGFNPHSDIDFKSLRFGASEEVNFGKGSRLLRTEESDKDLILVFEGNGNGFSDANFAGKLLGKTKKGQLLFGFAKLPWVDYIQPILSAKAPLFLKTSNGFKITIEVANFGQVASEKSSLSLDLIEGNKEMNIASGVIPKLQPFEIISLQLYTNTELKSGKQYQMRSTIKSDRLKPVTFTKVITIAN